MKHTKGPWDIEEHNSRIEIWNNNTKIATINEDHEQNHTNGLVEDVANARLIAAAPELLEALECLKNEIYRFSCANHVYDGVVDAMEVAEATIAKATGIDFNSFNKKNK